MIVRFSLRDMLAGTYELFADWKELSAETSLLIKTDYSCFTWIANKVVGPVPCFLCVFSVE